MGNKRFIINEADYQKFASDESLAEYRGEIIYIDTDNPSEIASLLSNASNILFNRGRGIFKLCYVMDMIVADGVVAGVNGQNAGGAVIDVS